MTKLANLAVISAVVISAVSLMSCEVWHKAGAVTGGEIIHTDCFNQGEKELVETYIAERVCPTMRRELQLQECDRHTVADMMHRACFTWEQEDEERLCYRLRFEDPSN